VSHTKDRLADKLQLHRKNILQDCWIIIH